VAVGLLNRQTMASSNKVKVGVACPIPGERAAFIEWLSHAGYEPVPMLTLETIARDLTTRPIEALIADVSLVKKETLAHIVKVLGPNRAVILIGLPKDRIEDVPKDATWMARPVTRDVFLLSVALGLAEGRPARRSPRTIVPKLLSTVDGIMSKVVDVSQEGVRLEITGSAPSSLPPFFTLKVPSFGVQTKVKRVWVTVPAQGSIWCGGILEKQSDKTASTWKNFISNAQHTGKIIVETGTGIGV
jgi:hypothetical protein